MFRDVLAEVVTMKVSRTKGQKARQEKLNAQEEIPLRKVQSKDEL